MYKDRVVQEKKSGHIYGLDGLRAIAIIGVIFYHMFPYTIKGGFLGVSMFFVLSGFLIAFTSEKSRKKTGFKVGSFYKKRLMRIYPPVLITVFVTVGVFYFLYPRSVKGIGAEVVSIIFGYNNWWQVAQNSSYFTKIANASPFTHIWSLAVELQFYVIWPLIYFIYLVLASKSRREKNRKNAGIIFLLILSFISAVLMGVLLPYGSDATRVYYGTDTRIYALLLGCVLGFAGVGQHESRIFGNVRARQVSLFAFFGGLIFLVISFVLVDGMADSTYTGMMQLVTAVILLLVFLTAEPSLPFGKLLENPVLDFIGKRSYEMYLFMYPVIYLFDVKKWTRIPGAPIIEILIILLLAVWEHDLVDWIIKHRNFALRDSTTLRKTIFSIASLASIFVILTGVWATVFSGKKNDDTAALQAELEKNTKMLEQQKKADSAAEVSDSSAKVTIKSDASKKADSSGETVNTDSSGEKKEEKSNLKAVSQVPVTTIGDSVMLGASPELLKRLPKNSIVDAKESRQVWDAQKIVTNYKKNGQLGSIVVIALGTNGTFNESAGQKLIKTIGKERHIYWVNVFAESINWEDNSNNTISKLVKKNNNVTLIDWHDFAKGHDSWFYNDGIHLKPTGQKKYAAFVKNSIRDDIIALKEDTADK